MSDSIIDIFGEKFSNNVEVISLDYEGNTLKNN